MNQSDSASDPNQDRQPDRVDESAEVPDNISEKAASKQAQQTENKKWYDRWLGPVSLFAGIAAIILFGFDLPQKWREAFPSETEESVATLSVKGTVLTKDNRPLRGAIVKLDKLPGESALTTSDGGFIVQGCARAGRRRRTRICISGTGYRILE